MDRSKLRGLFILAIVLLGLVTIKLITAINDPFFDGDAGYRLNSAHLPIVRLNNRIWLPFLQLHIWIFYFFRLPYDLFKLIPWFYSCAALIFLCKIVHRVSDTMDRRIQSASWFAGFSRYLFMILIAITFSYQFYLKDTAFLIGQEAIELAFFYGLLWAGALELKPGKWLLGAAAVALLIRETFWIYLFVITLLNLQKIVSSRSYRFTFLFLWAIPIVWLGLIPLGYSYFEGRLPSFPIEWPLGINKADPLWDVFKSCASLWSSLISSKAIIVIGGLAAAGVIVYLQRRQTQSDPQTEQSFLSKFPVFSLLSLAIIYGLILLFNPWEATFGNKRISAPLLMHAFVWAAILFAKTRFLMSESRIVARTVLVATIILAMDLNPRQWLPPENRAEKNAIAEISQLVSDSARKGRKDVCFSGIDYWKALELFIGSTLYVRRHIYKEAKVRSNCDVIIAPSGALRTVNSGLIYYQKYNLRGRSYEVFVKQ